MTRFGVALAAFSACVVAAKAPAWASGVRPIEYHARVLSNALRVYTVLDPSAAKVSIQVWYGVGGRNDPDGRSGLAHMVEHLMFAAEGAPTTGSLDQLTEAVGGDSNASTTQDFTEYHDTLTPSRIEAVLAAEAARMTRLPVTQACLDRERGVVERELMETWAEDPGAPVLAWDSKATTLEPPAPADATGGSIPDLRRISLDDVRNFHDLYYRPDNAVLVVSGVFDPARMDAWIDREFGAIAAPKLDRRSSLPTSLPPAAGMAGQELGIVLGFRAPPPSSRDAAVMHVIAALLTGGERALAYRRLSDRGAASEIFSEADIRLDDSAFYFGASRRPHETSATLISALREVLAELREAPVSKTKLQGAKNQLLADALQARETVEGLGAEIGRAAVVEGDARYADRDVSALAGVTAKDVQRVARAYLADGEATVVRLRSNHDETPSASTAVATFAGVATPARREAGIEIPAEASIASPPSIGVRPPVIAETRLANGLRIVVARRTSLPLASAVLVVPRQGDGQAGDLQLTKLAANVSLFGCVSAVRTVAGTFDDLGLSASSRVDSDAVLLSISGLAVTTPRGIALLARCVQAATPTGARFRLARRELNDADESGVADKLSDAVFDGLERGNGRGRNDRLAEVDPGPPSSRAVRNRRAQLFRPDRAVLVVAGDVDVKGVLRLAKSAFGGWLRRGGGRPSSAVTTRTTARPLMVVDAPGFPIALVAIAARTPSRVDAAHLAFELANSILGNGVTSRMGEALRTQRSLTYDVDSHIDWRPDAGLFIAKAQVDPSLAPDAAAIMMQELRAFAEKGVGPAELGRHKALFVANLADTTETTADLADFLATRAARREPLNVAYADAERISAVTEANVQAAAKRLVDPDNVSTVILADARRLPATFTRRLPAGSIVKADALVAAND